ncbi:hypothetical protein B0I35DRAFT_447341 [Stachybotrys elegans]|uniref:Uncharacterized protein n=1 Tax=Stachybotrys elegans TaxID=80388 RepID=A0A8K0SF56_9HYPO|nr:hypothetical protein B0I35DRAFT_447341 [Stachybotrys elegans]
MEDYQHYRSDDDYDNQTQSVGFSDVLFRLLDRRSVIEFAALSLDERKAIYRKNLVQRKAVIVEELDDDEYFNPDIAQGALLRQEYFMGNDETGKMLVREARDVYYGENHFNVRLYWLSEFLSDSLADGETVTSVAPLLKHQITVLIDLHTPSNAFYQYSQESDPSAGLDDPKSVHYQKGTTPVARWTQAQLGRLFQLTEIQSITLRLCTKNNSLHSGFDSVTEQTISDLSHVVALLIDHFGPKLHIDVLLDPPTSTVDIRSRWEKPSTWR